MMSPKFVSIFYSESLYGENIYVGLGTVVEEMGGCDGMPRSHDVVESCAT